jgi:uroporphyrinogen decarboxylase
MTPRENFRRLCRGEEPAWIPFTLDVGGIPGFTSTVQRRFEEETGATDPAEFFDYDLRVASVLTERTVAPVPFHGDLPDGTEFDPWGVGHWAGGAVDTYERTYPPFDRDGVTPEEIAAYPTPVCNDTGVAERVAEYHRRGYPVVGYAGSIYEWSWWLRGMPNFMMDLLAEPEVASALIDKAAGFTTELALTSARCGIDVLAFYDDAGMQTGMQIAPELWRAFIKPAWVRVIAGIRAEFPDAILFLHSCGAITPIVPDIVEVGFDILHPIQPECMDTTAIAREFGRAIVPCATLGSQGCFAFGTPDDVTREVDRLRRNLGADRRCLLCPSNLIQPETPWENILAFVAAARAGDLR